jgi:hypothetical protein
LLVQHERIVPLEIHGGRLVLGLRAHTHENSFRVSVALDLFTKLKRRGRKRN